MVLINTVIHHIYFLFTILISLLLLREIIKSEDPQEVVLYSIILIPFILRSLHLK